MEATLIQRKLWTIAGIYFIINVLQSFFTPLINDEAYYWVWSRHLAWGYYDHPPMVALWARLGFELIENELGNRLIAIAFGALGFVILGKTLDIKNRKQLNLYAYLFFSMVLFQVFGFINTPDAPLLFFGILYFYLLKNFLENKTILSSVLLGIAMSLLIYSKYHGILLIIFTLLPHAYKLLKSKYIYIAVFTGILCYMPHIIWQFNNDFASLQYHLVRRNVSTSFKIGNVGDYLLSLLWASSPLLFYHHVKAFVKSKYTSEFQKSLIYTLIGVLGFFILITFKRYIQAQWSLVAFIPLLIISYHYYKNNPKAIAQIKTLSIIMMVLIGIARIYFIVQDVPIKTQYHGWKDFSIKAGEVTKGIAVFEKYQYTSLYNFYNYPEKEAHNYVTLENRESQYNLWDSDASMEGKKITFFSKYIISSDSVILDGRNGLSWFYYKHLPVYHSVDHIKMNILENEIEVGGDSLSIQVVVKNEGNFSVDLSADNNFTLQKLTATEPYAHHILKINKISYDPIKLRPQDSIKISLKVTKDIFPDHPDAVSYLSFVYDELPPQKQSNYINENQLP
ncbi:MAG: ArnT family glycosyltransferase [Weeksellaceae bacterium]